MFHKIGTVFSMTNSAVNNQVVAFSRNANGTLTFMNAYNTGGNGTGVQMTDPLASQGSIIISPNGRLLFVVNAGSNSISSFAVSPNGELSLLDIIPSGGVMPNSLALFDDILYVSNVGNSTNQIASNVTGFKINCCGGLQAIPYATYMLSSPTAKPACIVFSPCGNSLVVSELSTNKLTVFPVCCDGHLMEGTVNASSGAGPFGSIFRESGELLVAEAGANALSSYIVWNREQLALLSGSVPNSQTATCWVSLNKNQDVAYTSNAGSDSISIYDINQNGILKFRKNVKSNPNGTAAPLDSGVSRDGKNLYVLNGNEGTISVFSIAFSGDLTLLEVFTNTDLPQIGAQGLAVL